MDFGVPSEQGTQEAVRPCPQGDTRTGGRNLSDFGWGRLRIPRKQRPQHFGKSQSTGKGTAGQQAAEDQHTLGKQALDAADFRSPQLTSVTFNGNDIDGGHDQLLLR